MPGTLGVRGKEGKHSNLVRWYFCLYLKNEKPEVECLAPDGLKTQVTNQGFMVLSSPRSWCLPAPLCLLSPFPLCWGPRVNVPEAQEGRDRERQPRQALSSLSSQYVFWRLRDGVRSLVSKFSQSCQMSPLPRAQTAAFLGEGRGDSWQQNSLIFLLLFSVIWCLWDWLQICLGYKVKFPLIYHLTPHNLYPQAKQSTWKSHSSAELWLPVSESSSEKSDLNVQEPNCENIRHISEISLSLFVW